MIGRHEGTDGAVTEARPADNVSPGSRHRQYRIDNDLTRRTEAEFRVGSLRVIGFYHSHPDYPATPSEVDRRTAWPYYVYAILGLSNRQPSEFTAWRLDDDTQAFAAVEVVLSK